jgi:hypothetical protein
MSLFREMGFSQVTHNGQRERPKEVNSTARATGAPAWSSLPGWQILHLPIIQ